MKRTAVIILVTLAVGGCAETKMVKVVNPTTGQFGQCEVAVDAAGVAYTSTLLRVSSARVCPSNLSNAGWIAVQ